MHELGLERVARLCVAVDLVLEARPLELSEPRGAPASLRDSRPRATKAAIEGKQKVLGLR